MKLKEHFCQNRTFPHPNITIKMERKYHSVFLDTFPELEIKLRQWASKNLARMSCNSMRNFINETLIPGMYETYLKENDETNNHLSVGEFLEQFIKKEPATRQHGDGYTS